MIAPAATLRVLSAAAAGTLLLLGRPALADALTLRYEPLFTLVERQTSEASGATLDSESTGWSHLFDVRLHRSLAEYLVLTGATTYEWRLGSDETDGRASELDARTWNTHVQLAMGRRELNLTPFYTRTEVSSETRSAGLTAESPERVRDVYGAWGNWQPDGLPAVSFRATRTDAQEGGGAVLDTSTTQASLQASYELDRTSLRYRLEYQNPVNRLGGVDSVSVSHEGRVGYGDRFLRDRVSVAGAYSLSDTSVDTRVTGEGGTVETRQPALAGLSAVEVPPATATQIALAPTPALVDGDRTASVGVNIGFGRSAAGDTAPRHVGAQLANAVTPVSEIHVAVDRPLPPEVAGAFSWSAYRSDDNLSWTPVALAGPVAFGAFDDRFEIPIERTEARYLKVVTRPLPQGATLDPRFADVLVTEIELLDVVPAAVLRGASRRTSGIGSASLRAKLLADRRLFYDLGLNLTHGSSEAGGSSDEFVTFDVMNGLSYDQALGRTFTFSGRLERTDSRQRSREDHVTRLSASLGAFPLPTLSSTATYSAVLTQSAEGRSLDNSALVFVQAQPYQGIALQGSASYTIGSRRGVTSRAHSTAVMATVTPHPALTLSGSFTDQTSRVDAAGSTRASQRRVEGGLTFAPVQAVYLSASLGRVEIEGRPPQRVSTLAASLRPFPRGTVYLSARYNESYDSSFETRTRTFGPSLRWNIHGANYLEASYSVQDTTTPLLETHLTLLAAKLSIRI